MIGNKLMHLQKQDKMKTMLKCISLLAIATILNLCNDNTYLFQDGKISGVNSIQQLDSLAEFSFAIMSDNKGDSPSSAVQFARMVKWMKGSEDRFVIGLGDHVKKGWENSFLQFIKTNTWWQQNFYPNAADGENEFYGENQGDWGAGGKIFHEVKLSENPNVTIRENGCEYYSVIKEQGYAIHLVQLHFPDRPNDPAAAFTEDSRNYLIHTLRQINKQKNDIIIAAAHSRTGFWIDLLTDEQKNQVMHKCDLVLSATTHFFERKIISEYEDNGALLINTGSVTYPNSYSPYGYVQVHVLENPLSLVVQYIDTGKPERSLQHSEYAFIKTIDGKILNTNFRPPPPWEDMDRLVIKLNNNVSKEKIMSDFSDYCAGKVNADEGFFPFKSGLKKGKITVRDMVTALDSNDIIFKILLDSATVKNVFGELIPVNGREKIDIAMSRIMILNLVNMLDIPTSEIRKTNINEVVMLEEWLNKQQ